MKIVLLKTGKTRKGHGQPDQTLVNQTNTGAVDQSDLATNSTEQNWKKLKPEHDNTLSHFCKSRLPS